MKTSPTARPTPDHRPRPGAPRLPRPRSSSVPIWDLPGLQEELRKHSTAGRPAAAAATAGATTSATAVQAPAVRPVAAPAPGLAAHATEAPGAIPVAATAPAAKRAATVTRRAIPFAIPGAAAAVRVNPLDMKEAPVAALDDATAAASAVTSVSPPVGKPVPERKLTPTPWPMPRTLRRPVPARQVSAPAVRPRRPAPVTPAEATPPAPAPSTAKASSSAAAPATPRAGPSTARSAPDPQPSRSIPATRATPPTPARAQAVSTQAVASRAVPAPAPVERDADRSELADLLQEVILPPEDPTEFEAMGFASVSPVELELEPIHIEIRDVMPPEASALVPVHPRERALVAVLISESGDFARRKVAAAAEIAATIPGNPVVRAVVHGIVGGVVGVSICVPMIEAPDPIPLSMKALIAAVVSGAMGLGIGVTACSPISSRLRRAIMMAGAGTVAGTLGGFLVLPPALASRHLLPITLILSITMSAVMTFVEKPWMRMTIAWLAGGIAGTLWSLAVSANWFSTYAPSPVESFLLHGTVMAAIIASLKSLHLQDQLGAVA